MDTKAKSKYGLRTLSSLITRAMLAARAGLQYEGERDLYAVFGYKKILTTDDFLAKYQRQDIASRVVDAPPGATWSNPPVMLANDALVDDWDTLVDATKLWSILDRVDRLARLNPFSLLLFGFADASGVTSPVKKANELLYVRALGSRQVEEVAFDANVRSPRFGMPNQYKIKFDDPATKHASGGTVTVEGTKSLKVHHSRTVHIVERPLEDATFGTPIIEKVYNLLDDLLKVAGGTSEIFWLSGRGGIQADIDKDMDVDPDDAADLADEIDEFMHQLRRVIKTRGVTITPLDTKVPDPKEVFNVIMALISGTTGIPRRILLGSEAGQLASEQDRANWAERIQERRALYATPWILKPTTDLLQAVGLLPEGEIDWDWPSAFIQNPLEEGQTMAQTARAIGNISRQTGNQTPMQLVSEEEGRNILGFEGTIPDKDRFIPPDEDEEEDGDGDGSTREDIVEEIDDETTDE